MNRTVQVLQGTPLLGSLSIVSNLFDFFCSTLKRFSHSSASKFSVFSKDSNDFVQNITWNKTFVLKVGNGMFLIYPQLGSFWTIYFTLPHKMYDSLCRQIPYNILIRFYFNIYSSVDQICLRHWQKMQPLACQIVAPVWFNSPYLARLPITTENPTLSLL